MGRSRTRSVLLVAGHAAALVLVALALWLLVVSPARSVAATFAEGIVSGNQNTVASTLYRGGYAGSQQQQDVRDGLVGDDTVDWVVAAPQLLGIKLNPPALTFGYTYTRQGKPVTLGELTVDVAYTDIGWRVDAMELSPRK